MTTQKNAQTGSATQENTTGGTGQERTPATASGGSARKRGGRGVVRFAAVRRARAAKMARDARVFQREAEVEAALANFYQAQGESEVIMRAATERAQQIMTQAQERCEQPRHDMHLAVARLHELGETAVSLRELTGLGAVALREILETHTDGRRLSGPRRRATAPSQPTAAPTAPETSESLDSSRGAGVRPETP
ncbi:hypothetical protein [Kineosporia sp. NBRC 101731]|uniref:hypothetical protein n=1 Tax=Kineosporia sp. NBRC 101731 TaxID=3032199 RepID=UPI0025545343|nr:hypothetical protein [Kineosporia sp. NBRC 101731]